MFGYEGKAASFGDLVGFPQTGTKMKWLVEGNTRIQRGHYRGSAAGVGTAGAPWQHPGSGYARYTGPQLAQMKAPVAVQSFNWSWDNFWV